MRVEVLRSTDRPERLVCQAARGDYYEGYVGDTEYAELMESVDFEERHIDTVENMSNEGYINYELADDHGNAEPIETKAKTAAFVEKQLSRGHYGPWEHPQITFAVEGVSRVTMAQITRHRHMTFDIQSMRYADFSDAEIIVPASLLSREERVERYPHVYKESEEHFSRESGLLELDEDTRRGFRRRYEKCSEFQLELYHGMVEYGIPKEDARFVLPLGTPVNMTFSGNARTFLHLLDMRKKANAQWEIRELSEKLLDELFDWMPYTFQYYEEHGPNKLSP